MNRVDEKRELKQNLYSGINTILISPRRWGKSSLVKEAMTELQKERTDVKVCYIDEFQNLAGLKTYEVLESKMRSVWQMQQKTSYCLYGSKRHMMIEIFNSSSKPFYRFGQIMFLSKIAEKEWVKFIVDSFKDTDKVISHELAMELVQTVNLHSWYVQQLAHFTWNLTEKIAAKDILQSAIGQIVNTNLPLFQNECEALTASQLNLLLAIVKGEQSLTASAVMNKYGLGTPQNVSKNKLRLQKRDLIDKIPEGFVFLDPVFERWFISEYAH